MFTTMPIFIHELFSQFLSDTTVKNEIKNEKSGQRTLRKSYSTTHAIDLAAGKSLYIYYSYFTNILLIYLLRF